MSVNEFFKKWNGRFCEYNNDPYKFQCVDLMRQYIKEVLGFPPYQAIAPNEYAKLMYKAIPASGTKYFIKIPNTPTGVPQQGDIVFWDGPVLGVTGIAGHVAIFDSGNVNYLISFDQNYPKGSPCKFVKHSYRGVMGWLRPRK